MPWLAPVAGLSTGLNVKWIQVNEEYSPFIPLSKVPPNRPTFFWVLPGWNWLECLATPPTVSWALPGWNWLA